MTIADCEHLQTHWYTTGAQRLGGSVWQDGPLDWVDGPDGQHLMFPRVLTVEGVCRGVERARAHGRRVVGAWLRADVDAAPLAACGFERGWAPWWMTAPLPLPARPTDRRIELQQDSSDADGDRLAVTRARPRDVWCAVARAGSGRRPAGHAWSIRDGQLAGVFDMEVRPRFRRQGLGSGLLHAVCGAAHDAGAQHAVLNATPEGSSSTAPTGSAVSETASRGGCTSGREGPPTGRQSWQPFPIHVLMLRSASGRLSPAATPQRGSGRRRTSGAPWRR